MREGGMKAWELLSDPKAWTKGAFARAANGRSCDIDSGKAVRWCVMGAIDHCYAKEAGPKAAKLASNILGSDSIAFWNDCSTTKHADVVAILKRLDI